MIIVNMGKLNKAQRMDFCQMLREKLVDQAVRQHRAVCETWNRGSRIKYIMGEEYSGGTKGFTGITVYYENGEVWRYKDIDEGAERMRKLQIK